MIDVCNLIKAFLQLTALRHLLFYRILHQIKDAPFLFNAIVPDLFDDMAILRTLIRLMVTIKGVTKFFMH